MSAFEQCIDFILNQCTDKELDVVLSAVERRKKKGGSAFSPEAASKNLSEKINASIKEGMNNMTESIRQFSADLISQEAPELSKEQVDGLVKTWIPDMRTGVQKTVAKDGKVNGIPADLMYNMIVQFVSFSIGEMERKENDELQNAMGDWQAKYWAKFPDGIQRAIKTFLDGKCTSGEFNQTIKGILDLR